MRNDRYPLIIAHRGASAAAPENTLAAFRSAVAAGAEGIELDVRIANDGVPVVIHDPDLRRTAGVAAKVSSLTSAELANIDVTRWFTTPRETVPPFSLFRSEGVPTLAATLDLLRDFRGRVYIELKCRRDDAEALARAACRTISDSASRAEIVVKSFRLGVLPLVRQFAPDLRVAALFAPKVMLMLRKKRYVVDVAKEFGADELSIHYSLATKKLVQKAGHAGLPVTVWTTDNARWVKVGREFGLKALITNDPALLLMHRRILDAGERSGKGI